MNYIKVKEEQLIPEKEIKCQKKRREKINNERNKGKQ
jgi:hypothetical protein